MKHTVCSPRLTGVAGACLFTISQLALVGTASGQLAPLRAGDIEEHTDVVLTVDRGHTDNLFQAASNERSGTYTAAGFELDVLQESRRVYLEITGDVERRNYSEALVEDETYGALTADIEIQAIPERFLWIIRDTYGQGRIDPFLSFGPTNREQINVFTTGPAFYIPVGERTEIRMGALTGQRSYDQSKEFDGDITESQIGLFRALSSTADFGIGVTNQQVEYDNILFDNEITRIFLAYEKALASGSASVSIGSNEVDFGTTKDSQPFFDISWSRDVGTRSSLDVAVENQFVDSSETFRGGTDFDDTLRTVDIFERTSVLLAYSIEGTRSSIAIAGRAGQDRYENEVTLDNDLTSFTIEYLRTLSASLDFGVGLALTSRDFRFDDVKADDKTFSIYFDRAIGRKFALTGEYLLTGRDGRAVEEYTENTIIASLRYILKSDD